MGLGGEVVVLPVIWTSNTTPSTRLCRHTRPSSDMAVRWVQTLKRTAARIVSLQSLWVYNYNRQDVLVTLQSLRVYKYNRQMSWSFYSHYGYTNTIDHMS